MKSFLFRETRGGDRGIAPPRFWVYIFFLKRGEEEEIKREKKKKGEIG